MNKAILILWGFLQLGLGFSIKYLSGIYDLRDYYLWIGVANLIIWLFIGLGTFKLIKSKGFDQLIVTALAANLVGIVAFFFYYFGILKKTAVYTFSQHYFLPMRSLSAKFLGENMLTMWMMNLDKVFLIALLLQLAAYGIGYLLARKA